MMQSLNDLLFTAWSWFALAVLLVIFDVILGASFFLLWIGLMAALVGFTVIWITTIVWEHQVLMFALGSLVSVVLWRAYLKKNPGKTDRPTLNRRAEQYVGRSFSLSEAIVNGRGKIEVDDSTWRVEGAELPIGTRVKVVDVDGVILKVEREA